MLKIGCLPYAVGKQPSIPSINLGKNGQKWTLNDDDDDDVIFNFTDLFSLVNIYFNT